MKNISKHILVTLIGLLFIASACQKDDYKLGELIAPSAVNLTYQIVGVDSTAGFPNGDGSGIVNFTATAEHEITFTFDFGDGKDKQIAADGTTSHQFSVNGTVTYNVTVSAIGTGGISSTKTIPIEVFSSFADDEAKQLLTGGTTKSWYWAADQPGHLGLGPNDMVYENGSHTYAAWYMSAPWEKSATTLYQCEFKFSVESGSFTFEQLNPSGEAFVQGNYASEFGLGAEGSYPSIGTAFDITGVKNVSFSPSASLATIDGGYRGTTLNFSNGGYMGFYAGSSDYEIIEVTENILKVRVVQVNTPLFAWYHTFTNVKPEQK